MNPLMGENMFNSSRTGMTRSSSLLHVNKDIGELVWENGEVKVQGRGAAVEERAAKLERFYCSSILDQSKKQIQQGFSNFKLISNTYSSSLSQQCKKPRIIDFSGSAQATTKSHTLQHLGTCNNNNNQRTSLGGGMVNFPNFLVPSLLLNKSSSAAAAATSSKGHDHSSVVIDSSNNNKAATQELKETPFHQVQPLDRHSHAQKPYHGASSSSAAPPPPNYNSNNNIEQHLVVASSPVSSIGASNDPDIGIMRKQHEEYSNITDHDHDDTTTYISDDVSEEAGTTTLWPIVSIIHYYLFMQDDEETEDVIIAKETPAAGTRAKRSRDPEVHNLSDRVNKRIHTLKELIPNCNKIMSMGRGLCMPLMMLHNHHNQLMCYRPSSGTGIPHQNMFDGFFNQMRPMIMPPSPLFINPTPPIAPLSIANSSSLDVSHVQAINNGDQVSLHQHTTSSSYPFYFPTIINQEEKNNYGME
nr:transcription factor PHYTOCHROME INTERACTING FACTOR-LIKE 15 isoform X2 [Arachis hypogaea]